MKKLILLLATTSTLLFACSQGTDQGQVETEGPVEEVVERLEETEEESEEVTEALAESESSEVSAGEGDIRKEAIEIVAADLGAGPEDLKILVAEVKANEVDLDFYYEGKIYEYEVKNGSIEDKEAEYEIDPSLVDEFFVGRDALKVALADAGLTEDQVMDIDIDFDKDDGTYAYNIDFEKDGREYEYKIDARTGQILEIEKD